MDNLVGLPQRVFDARRYLQALTETSPGPAWQRAVEKTLEEQTAGPEVFALLHPHFLTSKPSLQRTIQGNRDFSRDALVGLRGFGCLSVRIWGYQCDLTSSGAMNADHVFPYALGGHTSASNLLPLCSYHNLVKSHDVHNYPNWRDPPEWVWLGLRRRLKFASGRGEG